MGRGITNAIQRFNAGNGEGDYSVRSSLTKDSNMVGMIFVPYDDGQYSVHTNYAKSNHLIGYDFTPAGMPDVASGFKDAGDITLSTLMFKAEGVGEEINDFLDATTLFASYSTSKTTPKSGMNMLGETTSKSGNSIWIGAQMPCLLTEDGRFGVEYNKGSKYWRSMTYAEDTMIGSKIAARGTALEVYWLKPLTPSLSLNIRYTKIDYDYTGSNGFFGQASGTPLKISDVKAGLYGDDIKSKVVESASDFRFYIRYRF